MELLKPRVIGTDAFDPSKGKLECFRASTDEYTVYAKELGRVIGTTANQQMSICVSCEEARRQIRQVIINEALAQNKNLSCCFKSRDFENETCEVVFSNGSKLNILILNVLGMNNA